MLIFDSMLDGTLEDDDPGDDLDYSGPVDWDAQTKVYNVSSTKMVKHTKFRKRGNMLTDHPIVNHYYDIINHDTYDDNSTVNDHPNPYEQFYNESLELNSNITHNEINTTRFEAILTPENQELWFSGNKYFVRSATGFLHGLFNAQNATKCGSRLLQVNELMIRAVLTREFDTALYRVASIASLAGYLGYNCYFMGKEVYVTADDLVAFS